MHRPGLALMRLTLRNCDESLSSDVRWADRAREEHDSVLQVPFDQGSSCSTSDLVVQSLAVTDAKAVLERVCAVPFIGVRRRATGTSGRRPNVVQRSIRCGPDSGPAVHIADCPRPFHRVLRHRPRTTMTGAGDECTIAEATEPS